MPYTLKDIGIEYKKILYIKIKLIKIKNEILKMIIYK